MSAANFLTCKDGDLATENRWYEYCTRMKLPFVVVRIRKKYATIRWDCITLPCNLDDAIDESSDWIRERLIESFHGCCNTKSKYSISARVGSFERILPEVAGVAAASVARVLMASLAENTLPVQ